MNLEADPELQVRTQAKNVILPFDAPIKDSMQYMNNATPEVIIY